MKGLPAGHIMFAGILPLKNLDLQHDRNVCDLLGQDSSKAQHFTASIFARVGGSCMQDSSA